MSRPLTTINRLACAAFLTLALVAVVVRSFIPSGFMPDFSQAGTPLVICSGVEIKTIYIGEDGQPIQGEHKAEAPCDFALNSLALKPASLISGLFVPYIRSWQMADQSYLHESWVLTGLPEARGPPAHSI